jgi:hypothetical protein
MDNTVKNHIRDLPKDLTQQVNAHIRLFAVTMLISDDDGTNEIPCAGTLSSIKGNKGIITARHVWEEMDQHRYLLIMLGRAPHVVDMKTLSAIVPPVQSRDDKISTDLPDLAYVILPEPAITQLEAISKAFYSVDKRLTQESMDYIASNLGYYALCGNPQELIDYEKRSLKSFIYNTYLAESFNHEGWDYQIMSIDLEANPDIPRNFAGVSGGGIWKIKYCVDEESNNFSIENINNDIALFGVNFNQTDLDERQIIGHGPDSIYQCLYNLV